MSDLLEHVKELLETEFAEKDYPHPIVGTHNLEDDLGLDSLDVIELVMALEENCGVEIDDEEMEGVETVQDLCDKLDPIILSQGGEVPVVP